MTRKMSLLMAAGALALAPAMATASAPGGGGGGPGAGGGAGAGAAMHGPSAAAPAPTATTTTTATPNSPTGNGGGYNHTNAPQHMTGQPSASCETTGSPPGGSASAPGSAFNPNGTAGTKYAGEQPQNQRNTASVSQYDVACANQPH
jgi:hypothetical protein